MRETVQDALPLLAGGFFALALLLILVSLRLFRRSRTDVFWRRRREAGQRGWRLFLFASSLLVLASLSCALTLAIGLLDGEDSAATATATATQEVTRLAADLATPDATSAIILNAGGAAEGTPEEPGQEATPTAPPATPMIVIITATPAYSPTPTPFPTFTPLATPAPPGVTPRPGASLRITALSDQIDAALRPVNPRTEFSAGIKRIYFFVEFSGMTEGVPWRRAIFREDELFDDSTYPWGLASSGTAHFFFGQDSGFEPGSYELRLYIGASDTPASLMPFIIVPEP
jgi:hypothetical protein